jgi:hypothetical protein
MKSVQYLQIYFSLVTILLCATGCDKKNQDSSPVSTPIDSTTAILTIPHFVGTEYIELDKIGRISKFRSSAGHDYHDDFEHCRNMKHYFEPKSSVDWSGIKLVAPVSGTVSRMFEEWAGTQVQIQSKKYPTIIFIIFHIHLAAPLQVGDTLTAGQLLGTHIGSQTMSDMAVGVTTDKGWELISYFDVLNDSLFQKYQSRGVAKRSDMIITKEMRDVDTLKCAGDAFFHSGAIEDWVVLK